MAFFLILVGILVLGFIAIQIFAWKSQESIESYPYTVEKSYGDFEIRAYESRLFTSVKLGSNEYKKASSQGFSILAGYIFGANEKQEKIAMTSPVAMSLEDSMTMMFMVPKKFNKNNLPKPNQSDIEFKEMPAKRVAAITFGGWSDDEKIALHKEKLTKALDEAGIAYSNRCYYLGYNPPYEVFGRKNEVIVELE